MIGLSLVAVLCAALLGSLALWAYCLRLGLQWVRVEGVTCRAAAWTAIAYFLVQYAGYIAIQSAIPDPMMRDRLLVLFGLFSISLLPVALIMIPFKTTAIRAFAAYLWTLASSISAAVFVMLILRPFILEAFQMPTNGMAPTILGHHVRAACPECGRPCYSSKDKYQYRSEPSPMICDAFHITNHAALPTDVHPGDRFLVSKFVSPRRWDLLVFRFPEDPRTTYVKRLVGLPGETVYIKEGAIWVNDQGLEMPEEISGLKYLSETPLDHTDQWGTEKQPATLGDGQYFVLGDFSVRSYDSRLWRESDPNRPSYAVPQANLIGIVAATYWPPPRWRTFR